MLDDCGFVFGQSPSPDEEGLHPLTEPAKRPFAATPGKREFEEKRKRR
jgi:hypothetical protein